MSRRSRIAGISALLLALWPLAASAAPARIVSINLCTDQLLLSLADPAQIAGLSPYARDPAMSWRATDAAKFPRLSGLAEDALEAKPDMVLAGSFTRRATREFLKAQGVGVEEFAPARSIDDIVAQVRRMGDLVGHPDRAAQQIAAIDAAVARARAAVAHRPLRVLGVSRRGWVPGRDTLTTSLLATVGLSNAAGELDGRFGNFRTGGFASLEAIVGVRPDALLISDADEHAGDQGRAFLLHPALERLYPPARRMVLPERLTNCGGPMVVEALDRLAAEVERVER
jgi:iron complex transport system substrate-binding protein